MDVFRYVLWSEKEAKIVVVHRAMGMQIAIKRFDKGWLIISNERSPPAMNADVVDKIRMITVSLNQLEIFSYSSS